MVSAANRRLLVKKFRGTAARGLLGCWLVMASALLAAAQNASTGASLPRTFQWPMPRQSS